MTDLDLPPGGLWNFSNCVIRLYGNTNFREEETHETHNYCIYIGIINIFLRTRLDRRFLLS